MSKKPKAVPFEKWRELAEQLAVNHTIVTMAAVRNMRTERALQELLRIVDHGVRFGMVIRTADIRKLNKIRGIARDAGAWLKSDL